MKTLHKIAILCIVPLLFSCGENGTDPVGPEKPEERVSETHTLTFVLPDGPKEAWVAGDQIVVHGEYAKEQVTVTLEAADISADGKSATKVVKGLYPYKRSDCTSSLYASYPAECADNLKHCFFYSKFSSTNAPILAASNDNDTFQFQNICGSLKMKIEGDYEGYLLSTPKKDALGYEFLQVKITDKEQNFKQYTGNPVLELEGTLNDGNLIVYLPDGTNLEKGFVLKLKENGDFTKIYRNTSAIEITRGGEIDLGDVTTGLQKYDNPFSADIKDLDSNGNANCYIVTETGGYKFKAVKGNNSISFLEEPSEAVVYWETWNDNSDVTAGSVVASAAYAEDYVIIHMPETLHAGNAVVAVKNADGKILWSWHIWVPASAIQTSNYSGIMGDDLMDRNLGALVASVNSDAAVDPLSYGLMYQWGRKDPFTNTGTFNGSEPAKCAGEQDEVAAGQITLDESIEFPRRMGHINNGDWLVETNDNLWLETEKTIYDPCPPGYRVPKPIGTGTFWSSDLTAQPGWQANVPCGWFKIGSPEYSVFPIAGYRDDYGVGSLAKVGVRTLYWVSRGSGASGSGGNLRSDSGYKFGSAPKARLGSVRCTVE